MHQRERSSTGGRRIAEFRWLLSASRDRRMIVLVVAVQKKQDDVRERQPPAVRVYHGSLTRASAGDTSLPPLQLTLLLERQRTTDDRAQRQPAGSQACPIAGTGSARDSGTKPQSVSHFFCLW